MRNRFANRESHDGESLTGKFDKLPPAFAGSQLYDPTKPQTSFVAEWGRC